MGQAGASELFNLIPVPPLDGSHVLRVLTGMSQETYANFARFGFIIVIVLLQVPPVARPLTARSACSCAFSA